MESTYTRVADGVRTLWTKSGGRVVAHFSSVSIVTDKIGALLVSAAPIEKVKAEAEPEADPSRPALSDQEMETLMQQTHDAAHPLMPHAPVLVGAASCEDVVLRWRTVETDAAWPIHGYVVQRFPDSTHKLEWETLIESLNASESTDTNVRISQQYLYRVQAISGAARSPFAYHAVSMNQTSCYPNQSLRAYLPTALHVIPFIDLLSIEAVQTFVLIISCFLAVFGVMRSNVKKVQHTRSRQGRLRKMEKLISEESRLYTLPRLSSSETSSTTEPSTSVNELSSRSSQYEPFGPTSSLNPTKVARPTSGFQRSESPQRPASFSAPLDKSVCQYCHKKFGIFRRRRVCDVCEVVTLCRKCGVQAPSNVTVDGLRESLGGRNSVDTTAHPRVTKASSVRSRRPKTICRDCHEHAERFSRAPTHPLR